MKTSLPETTTARLPSNGLNNRRATVHKYDHSAVITIPARTKDERPTTGLAHFFRCEETGMLRVWGFDAHAGSTRAPVITEGN